MNRIIQSPYTAKIIDVDNLTGKCVCEYIDAVTGEKIETEERGGYVYKNIERGLTVRTLSLNVVNVSWLEPGRALKAYEIESAKSKIERDAKLDLNTRIVGVHNRILDLSAEKGFINNRTSSDDLLCYDEPAYTVAMVEAKIERGEVDYLVLDDIKKDLTIIMAILGSGEPKYCSWVLGELLKHKDENFRRYIMSIKAMIAYCG